MTGAAFSAGFVHIARLLFGLDLHFRVPADVIEASAPTIRVKHLLSFYAGQVISALVSNHRSAILNF